VDESGAQRFLDVKKILLDFLNGGELGWGDLMQLLESTICQLDLLLVRAVGDLSPGCAGVLTLEIINRDSYGLIISR